MWHKADGEVLIVIELAKVAHGGIGDHGSDRARKRIARHTDEPVIEPRVRYCSDGDCGLNEDGDDGDEGRAAKKCEDSDGGAGPRISSDERPYPCAASAAFHRALLSANRPAAGVTATRRVELASSLQGARGGITYWSSSKVKARGMAASLCT